MSKNIDVNAHVRRYEQTEASDVIQLIEGLQNLVEQKREKAIAEAEEKLAILKRGEIPVAADTPKRAPRGSKKKAAEAKNED